MLLAVLPFLAAVILYWMSCADVFSAGSENVPDNWKARLFLPVLTGSLSSLAAAAALDETSGLLLSVAGLGILFAIVVAAAFRDDAAYYDLQLTVSLRRRRLSRVARWHVVRYVGVAVVLAACVATLVTVR